MRKDELMKKYKMQICIAAAVALLGAAVFCGFQIYYHYAQVEEQTEAFEQMAELVEKAPEEAPKERYARQRGRRCPCEIQGAVSAK